MFTCCLCCHGVDTAHQYSAAQCILWLITLSTLSLAGSDTLNAPRSVRTRKAGLTVESAAETSMEPGALPELQHSPNSPDAVVQRQVRVGDIPDPQAVRFVSCVRHSRESRAEGLTAEDFFFVIVRTGNQNHSWDLICFLLHPYCLCVV